MLGVLVGYQKNNLFVTEHIGVTILCQKYLLKLKIEKYIFATARKLPIPLIVMELTTKYEL
tara:strand:- start:180 stop:362 length:183 start_codon:yes stop_codon:yes gene_type:complete